MVVKGGRWGVRRTRGIGPEGEERGRGFGERAASF